MPPRRVPTVGETLPGFNVLSINGVIAAGGTPRASWCAGSRRLPQAAARAGHRPAPRGLGIEPVGNAPEEFGAFIKSEIERWTRVAKAANVKME